jgi:hypothetical protein
MYACIYAAACPHHLTAKETRNDLHPALPPRNIANSLQLLLQRTDDQSKQRPTCIPMILNSNILPKPKLNPRCFRPVQVPHKAAGSLVDIAIPPKTPATW